MAKRKPVEKVGCIVLNKPFIGAWLMGDDHDAHELINFFKAEDGVHYIYNSPYGQNVSEANKYDIKYLIYTSNLVNKKFYIQYVLEIDKVLHTKSCSKANVKDADKMKQFQEEAEKEIKKELDKSLSKIIYDGVSIKDLFGDDSQVAPVTFTCKRIYKAVAPIIVENGVDGFEYNFQRNYGYVSESKNKPSYDYLMKVIQDLDNKDKWDDITDEIKEFKAIDKSSEENIKKLKCFDYNTFLDLVSLHKEEECYTQMFANLINSDNSKTIVNSLSYFLIERYCNGCKKMYKVPEGEEFSYQVGCLAESDNAQDEVCVAIANNKTVNIGSEISIKNTGRLDLYTESEHYRIIIENKIDSKINYVKVEKKDKEDKEDKESKKVTEFEDQLKRYKNYFDKKSISDGKINIYIVLAPEYRYDEINLELQELDPEKSWQLIGYGDILKVMEKSKEAIGMTKYARFLDDIITLCRRQSFERPELYQLKLTKSKISKKQMLNKENFEKFKAYGEAHKNERVRAAYGKALTALTQEEVVSNGNMQAVIGFNENDKPVFWDLEKDDLLSTCACGEGAYMYGQDLPIMSLELKFGKDKFAYYTLAGDGALWWNKSIDSQCLGFFSRDNKESPLEYVKGLISVVNARLNMTEEQLAKEPFLLFVFNCLHFFDDLCESAEFKELVSLIVKNRTKIKAALYCSEQAQFVPSNYVPVCNYKHATFEGAIYDKNNLKDENRKLRQQCCRAANFTDGMGNCKKVVFPDYVICQVLRSAMNKV